MNPYPERPAWGGGGTWMFLDAVSNLAIRWRSFLYQTENYDWRTLEIKNYWNPLRIGDFRAPDVWGVHENSFKIAQNCSKTYKEFTIEISTPHTSGALKPSIRDGFQ